MKPGSSYDRSAKRALAPAFVTLGPAGAAPLLESAASEQTNGQLEVEGPWALTANLTVRHGKVLDAVSGQLRGEAAAMRVFLWSEARYRWRSSTDLGPGAVRVTVNLNTENLITEGLRHRAVWQRIVRDLPPLAARFEVDFSRPELHVSELPSAAHELCRLCDGKRSLGQVLRDSAVADLEAASILGHLISQRVLVLVKEGRHPGSPAPDEPPIGDAGDEETALTPVARPKRPRPWMLVAIGLALGIGGAVLASASLPSATADGIGPTIIHPVISGTSLHSPESENVRAPAPSTPSAPAPAATVPAAPSPAAAGCDRARSLGEARRTLAACDRVASGADAQPDLLALLARLELERGAFAKAATRARRAIALDPNLAEAYAYLGFAEAEAGRRREAMAAYRRYLALAPRGSFAEDVRAIVHEDRGR